MIRTQFRRRLRRAAVDQAIVDGAPHSQGPVGRLRQRLQSALVSAAEREEVLLERRLLEIPAPTRPNTIAIASPTGGVGKTTASFLTGNLLASRVGLRVVAVDAGPDPGTLGKLARRGRRADRSLADLVRNAGRLRSASELRTYATSLPTGLHVLAGARPSGFTAAASEPLLEVLTRFYDVVILDVGSAGTRGRTRFALERADQLVLMSDPQWIAARSLLEAILSLAHERTTVVLNKARPQPDAGQAAIARRLGERAPDGALLLIPYDRRLAAMLDSGTYTLEALARETRVAVKRLGLAVAEQLV